MATGYISPNISDTAGLTYDAMLYCKTNIGGYFFDGFTKVTHSRQLEVTENPIETGASVVDHAYVRPAEITISVVMSDVHQSMVSGQFSGGYSRSVNAWNVLKKLQEDRIPMSVLTRLGLYSNMLITELRADDTAETVRALKADVTLREIPVARVKTVKISSASQTTVDTEMGKIEAYNLTEEQQKGFFKWLVDAVAGWSSNG